MWKLKDFLASFAPVEIDETNDEATLTYHQAWTSD